MEGLNSFDTYLDNLNQQAGMLAEAAVSINKSFEAEAQRLIRESGVQRLKIVHDTVIRDLNQAMHLEAVLTYKNSDDNLKLSCAGLAARFITAAITENQRVRSSVNQFFEGMRRKRPYGTIMVYIGTKGLPEDVGIISISELARESSRSESQVVSELQEKGNLLFIEQAFSNFIEKLVADVRDKRLCLPVSHEKLSEIGKSFYLAMGSKQPHWVLTSRIQKPTSIFRLQ